MLPLRVSENGRFLARGDGSPFFPIADTAWEIAWRLDRSQVEMYLDRRRRQRFNVIAMVAFSGEEGGHANPYAAHPFELRGRRYDPSRPLTTPGSDPGKPGEYDYWDHLEFILRAAAARGMYVILLPCWGNCVAGNYADGAPSSEIIFDAPAAYRYGRWLAARFQRCGNLIWMLGGDRSAVYGERDYRPVFRAMAEGLADGAAGAGERDGKADYRSTLMSYHPRKWEPNSSEWFHLDPWLDFNSIQDQPRDQVRAIQHDYRLSPAKPTWLFEGGYEHRANRYTDWHIRYQSYQTVFAGGFGVTYGNMNIYAFSGDTGSPDEPQALAARRKWEHSLDDPGARQMQHLLKLMTWLTDAQFLDRIPDQDLIDGDAGGMQDGEGLRSNCILATRGRRGDYAMVYTANGRNIRLKMDRLAGPFMDAFWFDPRTGEWRSGERRFAAATPFQTRIPSGAGAPPREFDPPGQPRDGNDWVLALRRGE